MDKKTFKRFYAAYVVAALWAEVDNNDPETGGEPLDANYGPEDLAPRTKVVMKADCKQFLTMAAPVFDAREDMWEQRLSPDGHYYDRWEQAAHDFWLTRNGHGSGFWDRPEIWGEEGAARLTALCKHFLHADLEVGGDQLIYQMGA